MFFMNRLLVLMCVMFAALGSANSYAEQKLQAAKSDIVFVSKQMGVPIGSAPPTLPKPGFNPRPSKIPRQANTKSAANSPSKA